MLRAMIKPLLAVALAVGIGLYVTRGDMDRVTEAVSEATSKLADTKERRVADRALGQVENTAALLVTAEEGLAEAQEALKTLQAHIVAHRQALRQLQEGAASDPQDLAQLNAQTYEAALEKASAALSNADKARADFLALQPAQRQETLAKMSEGQRADTAVPVVTRVFEASRFGSSLSITGLTEVDTRIDVRAETTGQVTESPFVKGSRVRKGDLLCRIDMGDRLARRAQAEAQLKQATIEQKAKRRLSQIGYASSNAAEMADAKVELAQAQIRQIDVDILRTEVRAPLDAEAVSEPARRGDFLSAGGVCAALADTSTLKVVGYVRETDIPNLSVGAEATARLADGRSVKGRISHISRTSDVQTRTYAVEVRISNPDGKIREGMTAQIAFDTGGGARTRLPLSAITLDDNGEIGVRVVENGRVRFLPLSIEKSEAEALWVSGLPGEAEVIVEGQEFVREGARVMPVSEAELDAARAAQTGSP